MRVKLFLKLHRCMRQKLLVLPERLSFRLETPHIRARTDFRLRIQALAGAFT